MHSRIWYAAVAVLMAAAGVYLVTAYAASHPRSGLNRGLTFLCRFGNPRLSPDRSVEDLRCPAAVARSGEQAGPATGCSGAQRAAAVGTGLQSGLAACRAEDLDPHFLEFVRSHPSVVKLDTTTDVANSGEEFHGTPAEPALAVTVEPAGGGGYGDCPKVMPPCADDAPDHMPYSQEPAPQPTSGEEPWLRILQDLERQPRAPDWLADPQPEIGEESEPLQGRIVPRCQEDVDRPYQYPGMALTRPPTALQRLTPAVSPGPTPEPPVQSGPGRRLKSWSLKRPLNGQDLEKRPPQPDIDTMEFRPSDARTSEYTKKRPL